MKKVFTLFTVTLSLAAVSLGPSKAQSVAINADGSMPNSSAMLDIKNPNKGLLVPRVALTGTNDAATILFPAVSLLVYNTATTAGGTAVSPGYYYWSGTAWLMLNTGAGPGAGASWLLTGNTGTDPATNFIGTTDNLPLRFRVNNAWAGEIHPTSGNIFLGLGSGQANTTAGKNTAIGSGALQTQSFNYGEETNNVAVGFEALTLNNPTSTGNGISNTAVGSFALRNNTTGFDNTALGTAALYSNTDGKENTAIGRQALFYNTLGINNTATGYKALRANSLGNFNTANGAYSLYSNIAGNSNTANGYAALYSNTTAGQNTAIGNYALYTQSYSNIFNNLWTSNNVAIGFGALRLNQPTSTTNGVNNTAVGTEALHYNITGLNNTANGYRALYNTIGHGNTAIGKSALYSNTSGYFNTAIGEDALGYNDIGDRNSALGYQAGPSVGNLSNTTCIGNGATATANNQMRLGNAAVTEFYCSGAFVGTTFDAANLTVLNTGQIVRSVSSIRYKKDIVPIDINTANIYKLRPVSYNSYTDDSRHFGLIAEEVAEIIPELAMYSKEKDVVKGSTSEKMIPDAVQYPLLSVLILKEVQKHEQTITAQQKMIEEMKKEIEELKKISRKEK